MDDVEKLQARIDAAEALLKENAEELAKKTAELAAIKKAEQEAEEKKKIEEIEKWKADAAKVPELEKQIISLQQKVDYYGYAARIPIDIKQEFPKQDYVSFYRKKN
jgi:DNA repair exonuclease SbcCD ATPase subunit